MKFVRALLNHPRTAIGFAASYTFLLLYALLVPEPLFFLGRAGGRLHNSLDRAIDPALQHVAAFAIVISLLLWMMRRSGRRSLVAGAVLACGIALCTEGAQQFIPERQADWTDLFADLAGIALVSLAIMSVSFLQFATRRFRVPPARLEN